LVGTIDRGATNPMDQPDCFLQHKELDSHKFLVEHVDTSNNNRVESLGFVIHLRLGGKQQLCRRLRGCSCDLALSR
jgi:hypothetical protein